MKALKFAGAVVTAVIVLIALLAVIGIPSGYLASTINAWNRLAISLRAVPGRYKAAASRTS